jgi:homoserine dehydrogenase
MTRITSTNEIDPVDVILLGVGAIGRELLVQIGWGSETRSPLRICGLIDRSGYLFEPEGLSRRQLLRAVAQKAAGGKLAGMDGGCGATAAEALAAIAIHPFSSPVLVDATAAETTELLEASLARGWDVVLANKIPLAGTQESADQLGATARAHGRQILHEATVGAGLPVIDTVRKLLQTGDRVLRIEGCPSGTLGYLFGELGRGRSFSDSLRSAIAAGYTEPDPRIDLSGMDVARKAIILARMIGYRGDLADVAIESLVPRELTRVSSPEFLERLEELDAPWEARVGAAAAHGKALRYRARVTGRSLVVGLVAVPVDDPLASLSGTDNQFAFTTTRYSEQPLVIRGPGAGPAVTAGGVHNDLLQLAERRGGGRAPLFPSPGQELAAEPRVS